MLELFDVNELWFARRRAYKSYHSMLQRCTNPNAPNYYKYGAKGITVCDRWKHSFKNFYTDMGPRALELSLDRIDNNKGYYKENCRWATDKQQSNNRRTNNQHTNKTHCKRGHEFTGDNYTISPTGGRRCLLCRRMLGV